MKRIAILVGAEYYSKDKKSRPKNLDTVMTSLTTVEAILTTQGFWVKKIIDQSRKKTLGKLERIFKRLKRLQWETLVFYFAGTCYTLYSQGAQLEVMMLTDDEMREMRVKGKSEVLTTNYIAKRVTMNQKQRLYLFFDCPLGPLRTTRNLKKEAWSGLVDIIYTPVVSSSDTGGSLNLSPIASTFKKIFEMDEDKSGKWWDAFSDRVIRMIPEFSKSSACLKRISGIPGTPQIVVPSEDDFSGFIVEFEKKSCTKNRQFVTIDLYSTLKGKIQKFEKSKTQKLICFVRGTDIQMESILEDFKIYNPKKLHFLNGNDVKKYIETELSNVKVTKVGDEKNFKKFDTYWNNTNYPFYFNLFDTISNDVFKAILTTGQFQKFKKTVIRMPKNILNTSKKHDGTRIYSCNILLNDSRNILQEDLRLKGVYVNLTQKLDGYLPWLDSTVIFGLLKGVETILENLIQRDELDDETEVAMANLMIKVCLYYQSQQKVPHSSVQIKTYLEQSKLIYKKHAAKRMWTTWWIPKPAVHSNYLYIHYYNLKNRPKHEFKMVAQRMMDSNYFQKSNKSQLGVFKKVWNQLFNLFLTESSHPKTKENLQFLMQKFNGIKTEFEDVEIYGLFKNLLNYLKPKRRSEAIELIECVMCLCELIKKKLTDQEDHSISTMRYYFILGTFYSIKYYYTKDKKWNKHLLDAYRSLQASFENQNLTPTDEIVFLMRQAGITLCESQFSPLHYEGFWTALGPDIRKEPPLRSEYRLAYDKYIDHKEHNLYALF